MTNTNDNVVKLAPPIKRSVDPKHALVKALEEADQLGFEAVVIVAASEDATLIYTSDISPMEANWVLDDAKDFVRNDF